MFLSILITDAFTWSGLKTDISQHKIREELRKTAYNLKKTD